MTKINFEKKNVCKVIVTCWLHHQKFAPPAPTFNPVVLNSHSLKCNRRSAEESAACGKMLRARVEEKEEEGEEEEEEKEEEEREKNSHTCLLAPSSSSSSSFLLWREDTLVFFSSPSSPELSSGLRGRGDAVRGK